MMITKKALPRRTFLRGAGVALGLPLLDAMVPALSAIVNTAANPVRRLGFVYVPFGTPLGAWVPSTEGAIKDLPTPLASLEPFRDQLFIPTNLEIQTGHVTGNHALSNACFLSAARARMTDGTDYELATTVDQLAARAIGKDTPLPSLELALDFSHTAGNCDNGFSCVYIDSMSWSSPNSPLPAEANPRVLFERLFGDGGSPAERAAEIRRNRSILDSVAADMARLEREVGTGDRARVGEYLDSIREVERRIHKAEAQHSDALPADLTRPVGVPESWEDHARLMFDLQALALQADVTRVISFQLAREHSARAYPGCGVSDGHHPLSHHAHDAEKVAKLKIVNAYQLSFFTQFLAKLRATPDGDGSLLDHSIFMYGSGMGDGNLHDHHNLPLVVVGGGAGRLKGDASGRHIHFKEPTPHANLLLTLLDKVGVHQEKFGNSTGKIPELLTM